MGLDQRAYTRNQDGDTIEIQSWRKHNALDGWMEALWRTKGNSVDWNCSELELNMSDIERLEAAVVNDALPETHGFFYGNDSRYDEYKKEQTLSFISDAYDTLREGKQVFYSCWF
jgi:hypothetical protein|tara:strand:- start:352 stop:696 length:345 start_codon:yes stop_codon:yes gene_type:complete